MATIAENLQTIKDSMDAIKQAIIDKGGEISGDISTWAGVIGNLSSDKAGSVVKITNKLNGAVLGDADKVYDTEEVLHTYTLDGATMGIIFTRYSLSYHAGIKIKDIYCARIYGGVNDEQGVYMNHDFITATNKDTVNISILNHLFNPATTSTGEKNLYLFIVSDDDGNYDIDYFYIQSARVFCFCKDTNISLYNGITKKVQDINYNDELLVWNFDDGKFDKASPFWIKKTEITNSYYKVTLQNGVTINLVGSNGKCHRLFNYDDMIFESATELVGKNVHTLYGISKVASVEKVQETCEYYNIITEFHMNLFANGILTSCRYNNLYPIKNMVFDKSQAILEPRYKIHERFRKTPEILPEYIRNMRLDENANLEIKETIEYISNLKSRKKDIDDFVENKVISNKIEDVNVGWISPDGIVYGYNLYFSGHAMHEKLATKICQELKLDKSIVGGFSKTLDEMGWVKISNNYLSYDSSKDITYEQEKALFEFVDKNEKVRKNDSIKMGSMFGDEYRLDYINMMPREDFTNKMRGK